MKKIFDCKLGLWATVFWATLSGCQTDSWESSTSDSSRRPEAIVAECTLCHSTQEVQRGPILHGMDNWYLLDQIQKFHSGVRGRDSDNRSEYLMGSAVKKIRNDYEMALAANWFPNRNLFQPFAPFPATWKRGRSYTLPGAHPVTAKRPRGSGKPSHLPLPVWRDGTLSIK